MDVAKHSANESVNRAERQADFWIFGGIYRPVFLEALPEVHMSRTAIDARADGSFNILVNTNMAGNDLLLSVELFDLEGNRIGETVKTKIEKGENQKTVSGKLK